MTSFIRKGFCISHASEFCGIFMSENSEKKTKQTNKITNHETTVLRGYSGVLFQFQQPARFQTN